MREQGLSRKNFDFFLTAVVAILCICGLFMVANATGNPPLDEELSLADKLGQMSWYYVRLNAMWIGLGIVAAGVVICFDYHLYGRLWKLIYWFSTGLLALIFILGTVRKGAQSWFIFGDRGFQPSEIAKLALILCLAKILGDRPADTKLSAKELVVVLFRVAIPLVLILLQPDLGTALVYIVVTVVMLFVGGAKLWHMGILGVAGAAAVVPMWMFVMSDTQKNRILVFLDPSLDPSGAGYNVTMAKQAVGSGQLWGKGMFASGSMTQLDYIPEQYSDFIFASAAETWGFVGAMALILLYAILIFRLLWLSRQAADRFGTLIVVGVMSMMLFHVVQNIGMCLGIMPVTGIPLPFVSYGGSAMITNMLAIGLALNVGLRRRRMRGRSLPTIA